MGCLIRRKVLFQAKLDDLPIDLWQHDHHFAQKLQHLLLVNATHDRRSHSRFRSKIQRNFSLAALLPQRVLGAVRDYGRHPWTSRLPAEAHVDRLQDLDQADLQDIQR